MRLNLDNNPGQQIKHYAPGRCTVGEKIYENSLLVSAQQVLIWAPATLEALEIAHWDAVIEQTPDVVLLGTGAKLSFPPAACLAPLTNLQIGVEVMDTAAACRTFNVLASEGRQVVAALLIR